ncbi:MAG: hypothetical protein ACQEXQ_23805 [Bacillota bacterium]
MTNNFYKILGTILMVISGLIYSLERITARISSSIIEAGHASYGRSAEIGTDYPGFFDNFFVWFFLFIGFLLLAYGFPKSVSQPPKT